MTNKEAIQELWWIKEGSDLNQEARDALDMAIKALETQPDGDCISRQAAIDVCNYAIDLWHGQLGEGIVIAVRKKIAELPSAQPEQHWIPVSERLPNEDFWNGSEVQTSDFVLITVQDENSGDAIVDYGYTRDGVWKSETCVINIPDGWKVTAWMPLPSAYREVGEQDG